MKTQNAIASLKDGSKTGKVFVYDSFFRAGVHYLDLMWECGYRKVYPLDSFLNFHYTMS
jgi:hypothetical protein